METYLAEYVNNIAHNRKKYLDLYQNEYPDELTIQTALEFLNVQYPEFRKEFTQLAMDALMAGNFQKEVRSKILEYNGSNIVSLYDTIIEISQKQGTNYSTNTKGTSEVYFLDAAYQNYSEATNG